MRFDAFTAGGSNTLASIAAASERCVNWYPEPITGNQEKGPMALTRTPGLSLYCTLPTGPVRGLWPGAGRLFAVGGAILYEIHPGSRATFTSHGNVGNDGNRPDVCQWQSAILRLGRQRLHR